LSLLGGLAAQLLARFAGQIAGLPLGLADDFLGLLGRRRDDATGRFLGTSRDACRLFFGGLRRGRLISLLFVKNAHSAIPSVSNGPVWPTTPVYGGKTRSIE
jgi:hypothetical protein